jgi:hypothetical protein
MAEALADASRPPRRSSSRIRKGLKRKRRVECPAPQKGKQMDRYNDSRKIPRSQEIPHCAVTLAGMISIAEQQRRQGLPPTPGSIDRIVRLARLVFQIFALAKAFRDARRAVLQLTSWDREFLREARIGA